MRKARGGGIPDLVDQSDSEEDSDDDEITLQGSRDMEMEGWLQTALEEEDSSEEEDLRDATNKEWETIRSHALILSTNKNATTRTRLDTQAT
jgi:hypothetical protein